MAINWIMVAGAATAVGGAATAVATLLGGASIIYTAGKDAGQAELATYKMIHQEKIPEMIDSFKEIDISLRNSFKVFEQNDALLGENKSLKNQLSEAESKRSVIEAALQRTQDQLAKEREDNTQISELLEKIRGRTREFEMTALETETIGGHDLALIRIYDETVDLQLDGLRHEIQRTGSIDIPVADTKCHLTYLQLMDKIPATGKFRLSCQRPDPAVSASKP